MSFIVDAESRLDYGVLWGDWLAGDTIAASTWTISPVVAGKPTVSNATFDAESTTAWVDDGTDGDNYVLTNHIVTFAGREHDATIHLRCRAR